MLNDLSEAALSAAMRGGTEGWGEHANDGMVRYSEPSTSRRRCRCGCRRRASHLGMANGIALAWGCELYVARWVRNPRS